MRDYLLDLVSTVCPSCCGEKLSRMSFCGACYHALPRTMQRALYHYMGDGYEEAFDRAIDYLTGRSSAQDVRDGQA